MAPGKGVNAGITCLGCAMLAALTEGFLPAPLALQARARVALGRQRRAPGRSMSMIIPPPESGYVCEEINDHPDYIPNMDYEGDTKPGATPEADPPYSLPIDTFEHGGAFESDWHDIPYLERPCYIPLKKFIDDEGLAMLPSEAEMLERDIQVERKKRIEARKERFADEPDEDLVDDTLDDVPLGTDVDTSAPLPANATPPPVDFDDNDGYDDGYDTPGDSTAIPDMENSAMF